MPFRRANVSVNVIGIVPGNRIVDTKYQMSHASGDGKRFVVHADEKLTAFLELESAIRAGMAIATRHSALN